MCIKKKGMMMRLQTKLSLGILPIIAAAIIGLGFWSVDTAKNALERSAEIYMQNTLKTFVENEILKRQEILEAHELQTIPSYVKKFQNEVIQQAITVQELVSQTYTTAHLFALTTTGDIAVCLLEDMDHKTLAHHWKNEMEKVMNNTGYKEFHVKVDDAIFHYVATFYEPWDWVIFLSISDDDLSRPSQKIRQTTLWVAGISTLACFVYIFIFFKWFVIKPVYILEQISLAMAERKRFKKLPDLSGDELGSLAGSMIQASLSLAAYEEHQQSWQKELEKKVEQRTKELRQVKESLQTILDAMPFGVTLVDYQKTILSANQPAVDLMGYEKEEQVVGTKCFDTFCINEKECPIMDLGQKIDKSDRCMMNREKKRIPIIKSVVPITLNAEKVLLEAFVDISRQKKAEELLAQSNKELNDFAYIASHDLKEPLRGMANYSLFLMEDYKDQLDEEGQAKLETLIKLCKREESLIDALLSYSRVGRTELRIERQSIKNMVDEVVSRIAHMMGKEGLELVIDPKLPDAACDKVWTGEVFYNLITNAIKYNDKPKKLIEIGTLSPSEITENMPVSPHSNQPVFFVKDNGIGILEKHLDKIFTIFKRLHGRDKFGGGTGAGLTIVEKIILRHNGKIWVESKFGSGTTFYFTLGENHDDE